MCRSKGILVIVVVLIQALLFSPVSFSQVIRRSSAPGNKEIIDSSSTRTTTKTGVPDSLVISTWKFNPKTYTTDTVKLDTLLPSFQRYNPLYTNGYSYTCLGNLGTAAISNVFIDRVYNTPFEFARSIDPYLHTPENTVFFHTYRPFTVLAYSSGGGKAHSEESLQVIHTQNVTPNLNFGIKYNLYSSIGMYPAQIAKDNAFTLQSSYRSVHYGVLGSFHYNKFNIMENGGLTNDSSVNSSNQDYLPVNLEYARNKYLNQTLQIAQSFNLGSVSNNNDGDSLHIKKTRSLASINWIFRYDRYIRRFEDPSLNTFSAKGDSTVDFSYFHHINFDSLATADTLIFKRLFNSLQFQLHEGDLFHLPVALQVTLSHEHRKYEFFEKSVDYKYLYSNAYDNIEVGANLFHHTASAWNWNLAGSYFISGYELGNHALSLDIKHVFRGENHNFSLQIVAETNTRNPDFLLTRYYSNHASWNFLRYDLGKKAFYPVWNPISQSNARIVLQVPAKKLQMGAAYSLLGNYVFLNDSAYPEQLSKSFSVLTAYASMTFQFWKIVSVNKATVQYASNAAAIALPAVTIYHSLFYEGYIVPHVLLTEIGYDLYYSTKFYANAYDAVTASFYTQHTRELGNYPFLDAFVNLKLKRTRFFFKYEHVNYGLFERNYFTALHYPANRRVFRFGLSWTFYD